MTNQTKKAFTEDKPKTHVTFYYENGKTFTARDVVCIPSNNHEFKTFTYIQYKTENNIRSKTEITIPLNDVLAVVLVTGNVKSIIKRPSKKVYVNIGVGFNTKNVILVEKPVVQKTKLKRKPVEPVVKTKPAKVGKLNQNNVKMFEDDNVGKVSKGKKSIGRAKK